MHKCSQLPLILQPLSQTVCLFCFLFFVFLLPQQRTPRPAALLSVISARLRSQSATVPQETIITAGAANVENGPLLPFVITEAAGAVCSQLQRFSGFLTFTETKHRC